MPFDITQSYDVVSDSCGNKYYQQGGSLYSSSYPYAATTQAVCVPDSASAQVHGYLIPSYYVQDYGAAGDGTTDDTTAIQNAINAANTAGGGIVLLGAKTYYIAGTLTPKLGVMVQGITPTYTYPSGTWGAWTGGTVLLGAGSNACFSYIPNTYVAQPTATQATAQGIRGFGLKNIGFDTFTYAVQAGSQYNTSFFFSEFNNLHAVHCSQWAFYFENFQECKFERLFSYANVNAPGTVGNFFFGASQSAFTQGNSLFLHIFGHNSAANQRGLVFKAYGGVTGAGNQVYMNDLTAIDIQNNQQGTHYSATATFSTGVANIPLSALSGGTTAADFPIDMPVTVGATGNGFTAYQSYFVIANDGTNIQLANTQGGAAVTPTGNGTATVHVLGFPSVEIVGYDSGANSYSAVQSSSFMGIDSEGANAGTLILAQRMNGHIDINALTQIQGLTSGNFTGLTLRGSAGTFRSSVASTVDVDPYSNAAMFSVGTTIATDLYGNNAMPQNAVTGFYKDASTGFPMLQLSYYNSGGMLRSQNMGGWAFSYPPGQALGQKTGSTTSTTSPLQLNGTQLGAYVYAGGSAVTWYLPQLIAGAPGAANASTGMEIEIINGATAAAAITLVTWNNAAVNSANGNAADNFNFNSAKTSYSIPQFGSIKLRAVYNGTRTSWAVIGNNGAT